MSYLTRLPIDLLKIDRTFIAALDIEPRNHDIASAIVELAHTLGMTVVAEGVESCAQLEQVRRLGCDACQGFYFHRPAPVTDLRAAMSLTAGAS